MYSSLASRILPCADVSGRRKNTAGLRDYLHGAVPCIILMVQQPYEVAVAKANCCVSLCSSGHSEQTSGHSEQTTLSFILKNCSNALSTLGLGASASLISERVLTHQRIQAVTSRYGLVTASCRSVAAVIAFIQLGATLAVNRTLS